MILVLGHASGSGDNGFPIATLPLRRKWSAERRETMELEEDEVEVYPTK